MALDGIVISNLVYELNNTLLNARISKIAQPETDELFEGYAEQLFYNYEETQMDAELPEEMMYAQPLPEEEYPVEEEQIPQEEVQEEVQQRRNHSGNHTGYCGQGQAGQHTGQHLQKGRFTCSGSAFDKVSL